MIIYLNLNILPQLRTLQQAKRNIKRKQRYRTFSQKNMLFTTFWNKPSERLKFCFFQAYFCRGFEIEWVGAVYLPGNKQKKQFKIKKKTRLNPQKRQNTIRFLLILFMDIFEDRLNGAQIFLGRKKNGRAANKFLKNEREWLRRPQTCPGKRNAYFWKT